MKTQVSTCVALVKKEYINRTNNNNKKAEVNDTGMILFAHAYQLPRTLDLHVVVLCAKLKNAISINLYWLTSVCSRFSHTHSPFACNKCEICKFYKLTQI